VVVVISKAYFSERLLLEEVLHVQERFNRGEMRVLPILYDMSVGQLGDIGFTNPNPYDLKAEVVGFLSAFTMIRRDQVRDSCTLPVTEVSAQLIWPTIVGYPCTFISHRLTPTCLLLNQQNVLKLTHDSHIAPTNVLKPNLAVLPAAPLVLIWIVVLCPLAINTGQAASPAAHGPHDSYFAFCMLLYLFIDLNGIVLMSVNYYLPCHLSPSC
jgi:hypothetical protein